MNRRQQPALTAFSLGLMGLGILALIYGDFALVWQPVPASLPARQAFAYLSGLLMLGCGIGLLVRSTTVWSARILFPYLFIWMLLKVPAILVVPKLEAVYLGFGEIAVLFSAGWMLFATVGEISPESPLAFASGQRSLRLAKCLFGGSLIPIGLSHILYVKQTVELIPTWLPFRPALAYLTGAGQILCGLAVIFSIVPRLAARVEAAMVSLFALLVWAPAIIAAPKTRLPWTAFFITWFFASSAWVVSNNIPTGSREHREV